MPQTYFQHVRSEIEPLLPATASRVLEIGCGAGATLSWLKSKFPGCQTVGIDGYAPIESELHANADIALIHDLDQPLPDLGPFDLVLALDVLEHLRWPERVLSELATRIDGDATLIVSLPNVSHYSVSVPLLLQRRFRYQDEGILDRTHLRFFVENTALALLNEAGFEVVDGLVNGLGGPRARTLDALSFGFLRPWLTKQFIMKASKRAAPVAQKRLEWRGAAAGRRDGPALLRNPAPACSRRRTLCGGEDRI
jgi:SAM-dependent methyltransferase